MGEYKKDHSVGLPQALREQFGGLERRLWRLETGLAICLGSGGVLLSFLLVFFSDRFWATPKWPRACLAGLAVLSLAGSALEWLRRWMLARRDLKDYSILVQGRYRRLGDRLLGIVELSDETRRPHSFSPELYEAAIHQVAADAAALDFPAAVEARPARRAGLALGFLGASCLAIGLAFPAASWNALRRWLAPGSDLARYTFVSLTGLPSKIIVPHGEPFDLVGQADYHAFWHPTVAEAQIDGQPPIPAQVSGRQFRFRVPGQIEPGRLRIRLGDAARSVQIEPAHRPSLEGLSAVIDLPAYLRYPPAREKIQNGWIKLVEGSRVELRGKVSRALASAGLDLGGKRQPLEVSGAEFRTGKFTVTNAAECAFTWRDQLGLEAAGPWRLSFETEPDAPPRPELTGLPREMAVLETEVLDLHFSAEDDFGVKSAGVRWSAVSPRDSNQVPAYPFQIDSETPNQRRVSDSFYFSPSLLGVPAGAVVEVRAFTTDFYPGRQPVESPACRIQVLGLEQHAEMVRQKLESLLVRLEEITRLEEKIQYQTRQTQEADRQMDEAKAQENLGGAQQDQAQNAMDLHQLSREGMKTLREALRNPTFSEPMLGQWSKQLSQMRQLATESMSQAARQLHAAQQNQSSRPKELSRALDTEQQILDQLARMQKQVNQGLDQLEALTLAQRLRKLGGDEEELGRRLLKIVPETIGLFPEDLPPRFREANSNLATEQSGTQKQTDQLQTELSRYFERTQRKNYGEVSQAMKQARTAEELDHIREMIQSNIAMQSIQNLESWSGHLNHWADLLEPKSDNSGGGGQGGPQGAEESLLKELVALLRLRERQLNVREQTRLLENRKSEAEVYAQQAKRLSAQQGDLRLALGPVKQSASKFPVLIGPLEEAGDSMGQAETLLKKPQTDQATSGQQTSAIQSLTDAINLINEAAKKNSSSSSQSASEEMALLMQVMAMQPQPGQGKPQNNPGGNTAGGGANHLPDPIKGADTGAGAESRQVRRGSGASQTPPSEFREALDNYYRAVEQSRQ